MKKKLIFDCESDGMYGNTFAVSNIILDNRNNIIKHDSMMADINIKDEWVKQNVLPNLNIEKKAKSTFHLRNYFFEVLQSNKDCEIWVDCCFPVETNFLAQIARDDVQTRAFIMPYPIKDISSLVDSNISRKEMFDKEMLKDVDIKQKNLYEIKEHNPLHDCIASAYALTGSKNIINCYLNKKLYI